MTGQSITCTTHQCILTIKSSPPLEECPQGEVVREYEYLERPSGYAIATPRPPRHFVTPLHRGELYSRKSTTILPPVLRMETG